MTELHYRTTLKAKTQLFTQTPQNSTEGLENFTNNLTSSKSMFRTGQITKNTPDHIGDHTNNPRNTN
ncbi:hypothetical protein H5410_027958 [Solanum commersonii]|uniref:Uncharacterized protein n=1 Tax=Solanum commersonii TaxID=4109 RepID=A0A9J5Z1A8_SOLCO|nr:hypothetical protein H5410_027958 [Solanum commersonii]